MPDGPDRLKDKFMKICPTCDQCCDDGIGTAEDILKAFGAKIHNGMITMPKDKSFKDNVDVCDAIDYLCLEWDYDWEYAT